MPKSLDFIRSEHQTMTKLLNLLESQIDLFERAERPDYELIKEIIDYFLTFPDLYHHPKEDVIYRALMARDPSAFEGFGDLEEQHEQVSDRLHTFTRAVVSVMLEAEMPRETFINLARDFIASERRHMEGEEAIFFPAAEKTLTEDDWREIDARVEKLVDPLARNKSSNRFLLLSERLAS